eukprot:759884-Hanusia_phi.AAC.3
MGRKWRGGRQEEAGTGGLEEIRGTNVRRTTSLFFLLGLELREKSWHVEDVGSLLLRWLMSGERERATE